MSVTQVDRGTPDAGGPVPDMDQFLPYLFHLITSRLSGRMLDRLRPYGVTVQRWRVLMVLMRRDGRPIGELEQVTLIPQSALSRVVDQMARDGLVTRRASQRDSRRVEVHLTEHGCAMYRQLAPVSAEHAEAIVASFTGEERAALFAMLHRVLHNLDVPPFAQTPGEGMRHVVR